MNNINKKMIGDISSKELSGLLSKPKLELMREINYVVFSLNEFISKTIQKDHFINSVLREKKIFNIGSDDELKEFIRSGQAKSA
jgi:hypothetical protein